MGALVPPPGQPRVVEVFLHETAERLVSLRRASDAGNLAEAGRLGHSLKGVTGAFGARWLSALGTAVETAAGEADAAAVAGLVPVVEAEFDAFRTTLLSRMGGAPQP